MNRMKKFFIKALFIFVVFNCSHAISIEYQTTSPYWSTLKNGPTSIDQAIEMFFKDRKLDIVEGIWSSQDWGLVAIVKDGSVYKEYNITVQYEDLNGTWHRTLLPTASPKVFTFFTQIIWPDGNWYKFSTSTGTLILEHENFGKDYIDQYAANPEGTLIRNWPTDFNEHNAKIENENESKYITKKKWYKVAVSKDGELTSYVDRKSIKKKGNKVIYYQLDSLEKGIDIEGDVAYSAIEKLEGNCGNNSARFLSSVYYQKKMGKGKIIYTDNSISEWEIYEPGSVLGIVLDYVCTKTKTKDFKEENVQPDSSEKETEDDWF